MYFVIRSSVVHTISGKNSIKIDEFFVLCVWLERIKFHITPLRRLIQYQLDQESNDNYSKNQRKRRHKFKIIHHKGITQFDLPHIQTYCVQRLNFALFDPLHKLGDGWMKCLSKTKISHRWMFRFPMCCSVSKPQRLKVDCGQKSRPYSPRCKI